jgi:hypothetical protein
MSNWKASMPSSKPDEGKTHIVVAMKREGRSELYGQVPSDQAAFVMALAQMSYPRFLQVKAAIDSATLPTQP